MQKQEKSRKPLIIGIVAAVVILAALLALLLTQCVGGRGNGDSTPTTTVDANEVPTYELYWNVDREEYDGKSEAGMSSRMPEDDGYFHVRFFYEGEIITLKVADRKLINAIDVQSLMGLEFDENGIVIGVLKLEEMPLEKVGWQFFVQSAARTMIKLNSSEGLNGMEVLLEDLDPNRIWDMTGKSGPVGSVAEAITYDKIMAVQNQAGQVTHVFIFERPNWMMSHKAYCEHCKEEVEWLEWVKTDEVPTTTGHYQLQNDIAKKTGQTQPAEDTKICLDLNGYRIDGKSGSRVYAFRNVGITMAIMDTSEKQNGVIATHGKHDQGGPVWVTKGALYLYSGSIDASDATSEKSGVALSISNGAYFYMYGGSVIGGTATYTYNEATGKYGGGLGGAITCSGKMVMNGGEIRDGHAEAVAIYKDGKIDSHQRGNGGNLYVSSTGVFEMNGGTIKNGRAGSGGANIYGDGKAEITINGGSIEGGVTYGKGKNGGSIFLGSKTTFTMNGGSIIGGTSYNAGGNLYTNGVVVITGGYIGGGVCRNFTTGKIDVNSANPNMFIVNGKVTMWGGTIAGGVSITDTKAGDNNYATLALYGAPQITGGTNGIDLTIAANENKIIVGTLYDYAKIGVTTTKGLFSEITSKDNLDNFYSNTEGAEVVYFEERLGLGRAACICGKSHGETVSEAHNVGCDGKVLFWAPWTSATSIPTTTGNFYLLKDVTTAKQTTILSAYQNINLDLNGKNITLAVPPSAQDGFRLYRCDQDSKLAITDTTDKPGTLKTVVPGEDAVYPGKTVKTKAVKDEDGNVVEPAVYYTEEEMRAFWANGNTGMLLWARGGEISVHNGILDGSNLTGDKNGMVIYAGTMSVTDEETGEKTTFYGKVNIYGGTVKCGYTKNTGNIFADAGCALNMYGGEITGGRSNDGGNVYVSAKSVFNMYGGTISDGLVDRSEDEVDGGHGGNIYVAGTMNMYGGTVDGGSATGGKKGGGHGGNIYAAGKLNAQGGLITAGWAKGVGGNIGTVTSASVIDLAGVKVTDGEATIGGNVGVLIRSINGLKITDGTVLSGGHARGGSSYGGGGNLGIRMSSNARDVDMNVVISDTTITGGTSAHSKAANVLIENITADKFDEKSGKQTGHQINVNLEVSNSVIDGDFFVKATKPEMVNMTMSGKMVIGEGATTGLCLDSANPSFIALPDKLAAGSSVLVEGAGFISGETAAENKGFFSSTVESVEYYQDRLFIGRMYCICGASIEGNDWAHEDYRCDGTIYGWAPWTSTSAVPAKMGTADGHWFLTNDIQAGAQTQIYADEKIVLDLNGKTVKAGNNARVYALWEAGASLDITDTSKDETGALVAVGDKAQTNQGFIWARPGTKLTLHRGTVDASDYMLKSNLTLKDNVAPKENATEAELKSFYTDVRNYDDFKNGAAVSGVSFTMNGGTVIGGICYQVGVDANGKVVADEDVVYWVDGSAGGAVAVTNFDMYGGVIRDGISANVGGNVYVTGTFNMYGGEILNGSANKNKDLHGDLAYGGNVYAGTMYMYGGRIAGGVAYSTDGGGNGGNVFVSGEFQGFGGTIEGGTASTAGNLGSINSSAVILLDGTNLIDGTANNGGNLGVYVRAIKSVTITERTTISGGNAIGGNGGNILITANSNTGKGITFPITINGVIENGTASGSGGNIAINNPNPKSGYTHNTLAITMDGAVISGGTANAAGNIYIYNSVPKTAETDSITLTMNNVKVSDGTARKTDAGNLYIYSLNGADITGSTFEGGSAAVGAEAAGGNLWLNGTEVNITDSTITGGEAKLGGAIYASNVAKVNLTNSVVENGTATKGGNIYNDATVTTTNTTISGGAALTHGGNIHVTKAGTANLNAGTEIADGLVESPDGHDTTVHARGGNICAYGKLNMDTATVHGGRVVGYYTNRKDSKGSYINFYGMGGNIFVGKEDSKSGTKPGVAIINNSEIYDGLAMSFNRSDANAGFRPGSNLYANDGATLTLDKGTVVTMNDVNGISPDNNIYTTGNQTDKITKLNLLDCTVVSNISKANVYIENAQASINGATLIQNVATANNLATNDSGSHAAKVTMESGTIEGGKVQICDKDLFTMNDGTINAKVTFSKTGAVKLTGGTVDGGIDMISTATLTLAGAPTVTATNGGVNLNGNTMTVEGKLAGGMVYTSDRGYITGTTESGNEAYFKSVQGYGVTLNESKVFIGKVGCLCATPDAHTPGCIAAMKRILGDAYTAESKLAMLPVESAEEVTTAGYWYLHKGLELDSACTYVDVPSDESIVIDLNGKTIHFKNQNGRMFTDVGGNTKNFTLVITDTTSNEVAKQKGTFKLSTGASGSKDQGGLYWMTSTDTNLDNHAYVLGGHLDASDFTLTGNGGGWFYIDNKEGHVYMYNGEMIGAKANPTSGVVRGGSVYVYKAGTFEMFDGIIRDGHASSKDGNGVWGGNICMFDTGANFIMHGGLITGGVLERTSTSTASMNGANLYVRNGTFEMNGGQIDGGVLINTDKAKITGNSIIKKGDKPAAYSMSIVSGKVVDVSGLTGELLVSGTGKIGVNANETILGKVTAEETGKSTSLYGTDLYIGLDYCMCGYTKSGTARTAHATWCDKAQLTWIPLSDIETINTDANFYLADKLEFADQNAIKGGAKVNIDLNGYDLTVKAANNRLFRFFEGVTVGITDTSANDNNVGSGKMIGNGCTTQCGALLIGNAADTDPTLNVNLYSGTITVVEGKTATYGGILQVGRGTVFTMYGGTITGGTAINYGGNIVVNANGQFVMKDGTVSNGKAATNGGNIVVCDSKASFIMEGGIVSGGMTTVSGYELGRGGNIYVTSGTFRLEGGEIKDGIAQTDGGNIYSKVNFTMTGGTVSGGKANPDGIGVKTGSGSNADSSRGGNIWTDGGMKMEGGLVTEGQVFYNPNGGVYGGNIGYSGKLEITGGEIKDGKANNGTGGNIGSASSNSELSINNATVSGGKANSGGNICQNVRCGKSITIGAGAVIENGTATSGNGGNIALLSRASQNRGKTMTVSIGGTVKNGSASGNGDDIYLTRPHGTATYKVEENGVEVTKNYDQDVLNATISGTVIPAEDSDCSIYIDGADTMALSGEVADIQVKRTNATVSGKIDGGITFADTASTIALTGAPKITAKGGGVNLNGNVMTVEAALGAEAEIYTSNTGFITGTTVAGNEAYFNSIQGYPVTIAEGKVFIGKVSCLCAMPEGTHTVGCFRAMSALGLDPVAGDKLAMKPVEDVEELIASGSGYWYLPGNISSTTMSNHISVGNNKSFVLDMNGYTWDVTRGSRIFTTQNSKTDGNAVLILTDTSEKETGKIALRSNSKNSNQGGILWVAGNGSKANSGYLLSGTLDASGYQFSSNDGAAICVASNNKNSFYMYGGTIIGAGESLEGWNSNDKVAAKSANGGAVAISVGNFYLYDGLIKGGHAGIKNPEYTGENTADGMGGNVILSDSGKFVMMGGKITEGVASVGSNVAITSENGVFEMSGGEITGGVYVNSNNVKITKDATISKGGLYSLKIEKDRVIDVDGLTGKLYVTAEVGEVFAKNAVLAHQTENLVESEVVKSGAKVNVTYLSDNTLYMGVPSMTYCLCGTDDHAAYGCDGTEYAWIMWDKNNVLPTESGNYQLAFDITELAQVPTPEAGAVIRLNLNGKTINLKDDQNLYNFVEDQNATIIVTDTSKSADGQVILTGSSSAAGGMMDMKKGHTFELYRATLDASGFTCLGDGVVARIDDGASFTVRSGKVIGGTAGSYSEDGEGTVTRVKRDGGCFLVDGGDLTVNGGEIIGGTSYNCAGTIHVKTGNFYLNGGTISGGKAWEGGGSIRISRSANFVMTNGTISGGQVALKDGDKLSKWSEVEGSGNIIIQNTSATISGGTIMGGVYVQDTSDTDDFNANLNISGKTVINGKLFKEGVPSLAIGTRSILNLAGALTEGADVWVSHNNAFVTAPSEHAAASLQYFHNTRSDVTMIVVDADAIAENPHVFTDADLNKIYSVATANYYCECGGKAAGMEDHTCTPVIWKNWTNATQNPNVAGNWKLTTSTKSGQISNFAGEMHIDLNGYNINANGTARVYGSLTGTVTVTDSHVVTDEKPVGTITGNHKDQGGTVTVVSGGTFTLYEGNMVAGQKVTHTSGGGVLYINGSTFNMYGGSISGGEVEKYGGNITLLGSSTFNMYGGEITGGESTGSGGNVGMFSNSVFNMKGGEISNGYAGSYGGNVYIDDTAVFNMSGDAMVTDGNAVSAGGNFTVVGELHITGGTVSDGLFAVTGKSGMHGGNIRIDGANAKFTVKNATIKNGGKLRSDYLAEDDPYYMKQEKEPTVKSDGSKEYYYYFRECYGGNIAVVGKGAAEFEIGEGTVISGGAAHRGGNFYIGELTDNLDTEYKITGGTISGGKKGHRGANIAMYFPEAAAECVLYISGGEIIGASASDETIALGCGGGSFNTKGKIVMTGGEIKSGKITVYRNSTFDYSAGGTLTSVTFAAPKSSVANGKLGTVIAPE